MSANKFTKLTVSRTRVVLLVTRDCGCRSKQYHTAKVFVWHSQMWLRLIRILRIHLKTSGFANIERQ